MKIHTYSQIKVIEAENAKSFEAAFNTAMRELATRHPSYQLDISNYRAFITYEQDEKEAESIADEYEIIGTTFTCGQCPYIEVPCDGRIKWCRCTYTDDLKKMSSPCCNTFYEKLSKGQITPREVALK